MMDVLTSKREPITRKWGLSAFDLKCIAMVIMLLDHIGAYIYTDVLWFRIVGRLSFPIFCFLIVEGYLWTKNVYKYMLRLGIFSVISEIPFDLAKSDRLFDWLHQNVYFTLLAGLLCVWALDKFRLKWQSPLIILAACLAIHFGKTDYGVGGVLMILGYYIFYNSKPAKYIFEGVCNIFIYTKITETAPYIFTARSIEAGARMLFLNRNLAQGYAIFAFIPMSFYNGKRGLSNEFIKYFFYAFYPLHHLIIFIVRRLCF